MTPLSDTEFISSTFYLGTLCVAYVLGMRELSKMIPLKGLESKVVKKIIVKTRARATDINPYVSDHERRLYSRGR